MSLVNPELTLLTMCIQSAFAAQILFIACSCLAKCSTMWLMMRLFNLNGPKSQGNAKSKLYFKGCLGVVAMVVVWGIGSIIGLSVECSVTSFIRTPSLAQCPNQVG